MYQRMTNIDHQSEKNDKHQTEHHDENSSAFPVPSSFSASYLKSIAPVNVTSFLTCLSAIREHIDTTMAIPAKEGREGKGEEVNGRKRPREDTSIVKGHQFHKSQHV